VESCGNSKSCLTPHRQVTAVGDPDFVMEPRAGQRGSLRACSACAGDYEDPDRTAWRAEEEESEEETGGSVNEFPERFPVERT